MKTILNRRMVWVMGLSWALTGCASTQMKSVHHSPEFHSAAVHKALVVGLIKAPDLRKTFEEEVVRQWKVRGVDAVSSLHVLPAVTSLDKAGIAPFAKTNGYDVVLVTRLLQRQPIDSHVPVRSADAKETAAMTDDGDMSEYFTAVVASPGYDIAYQVASVDTSVFSGMTGKRLWSGITQTLVTGDIAPLVPGFIKVIFKAMYDVK